MPPARIRRRSSLGLALIACLAISAPAPAEPDPFDALDLDFRGFYAQARAATLARIGPLIIADMDRLTLIHHGARSDVDVIPPLYHRLKAVSHVPLALYVALAPFEEGPIAADRLEHLRAFRPRIEAVDRALAGAGLSDEQLARSHRLLRMCLDFLDETLASGRHDPAPLLRLTRSAGPLVLAHATDAARAQIDAYHAQIKLWREQMPPAEWADLRALVMGVAMPRRRNAASQYFAKLLRIPGESSRLVYAEQFEGERRSIDLLGTHLLDARLSEAFFDDPDRMEFDLLGNAAAAYLDTLDLD